MMFGAYILLIFQMLFNQSLADHYWRDYVGIIPSDAIPVDDTEDGVSYIKQVYVNRCGLWAGTITPRSRETEADPRTMVGAGSKTLAVDTIDVMTKILCAKDQSNIIWLKTTKATLRKDLQGNLPIVGGYVHIDNGTETGVLYVGRTRYNNRAIIVNVLDLKDSSAIFNSKRKSAWKYRNTDYEVLVYRERSNYISLESI